MSSSLHTCQDFANFNDDKMESLDYSHKCKVSFILLILASDLFDCSGSLKSNLEFLLAVNQ